MIGLLEFSWAYWTLVAVGFVGLLVAAIYLGEAD